MFSAERSLSPPTVAALTPGVDRPSRAAANAATSARLAILPHIGGVLLLIALLPHRTITLVNRLK
jgi:hypothetical protein